jgi:phage baseplate assembly protein W
MPSINLDILGIPAERQRERELYTDLHSDLTLNYTRNNELEKKSQITDITTDKDVGAIRNAVINILTTNPGEKLLNPLLGTSFGNLLFLPCTEERAGVIGSNIIASLSKFEPRIRVVNLEITPFVDNNEYVCNLTYTLPQLNNRTLQLQGTLSQSGFYV